jgi:hypothetical protein
LFYLRSVAPRLHPHFGYLSRSAAFHCFANINGGHGGSISTVGGYSAKKNRPYGIRLLSLLMGGSTPASADEAIRIMEAIARDLHNEQKAAGSRISMDRRDFLKKTAAGALLATPAVATQSVAAPAIITHPSIQWRMASSYPKSLDTIHGAAEVLARRVAELTDNRFRIRVFAPGDLVPGLQVMDAVGKGTCEAGAHRQLLLRRQT